MAHTGSRDLEYPQPWDHGKKIKPGFNCNQNATPSAFSALIADTRPSRGSSSRQSSPAVLSSYTARHFTPFITSSNDPLEIPKILDTQLAIPLSPSSFSNEHFTALPCWKRLTSNPGPTSQSATSRSPNSSISSHGSYTSDPQYMSWSTTNFANSESDDTLETVDNDADDQRISTQTRPLKHRRRPKRKFTHLLLDDAKGFDCGGVGRKRKVDCMHTSEIIDSGGDTMVPESIVDSCLPKNKEAKMK